MAYNNLTSRTDAASLLPEQVVNSMLGKIEQQSAALNLFRRIPVSHTQVRFPILSAIPIAYFVTGDTGLKQTSEVNWTNKYLNVEEIAVILPIPQNVVDDIQSNGFDLWGEVEGLVTEAIGKVLDAAVFFGTNKPASWPSDVVTAAAAAGNTNAEGDTAAQGGFMGDLDDTIALLEADGYEPDGFLMSRNAKAKFRAARSTTGDRLDRDRVNPQFTELDGAQVMYPMRGAWPATVRAIVLQRDQFVLGVRKDITVDFSQDGVIQDGSGAIVYNLFQQDMVGARFTFRAGWQVANTINDDQPTEANRYPAATQTY